MCADWCSKHVHERARALIGLSGQFQPKLMPKVVSVDVRHTHTHTHTRRWFGVIRAVCMCVCLC
jgi:hypothetical protein